MVKPRNNIRNELKNKYLEFLPKVKEKKLQMVTTVSLTFFGITILGLFAISPTLSTIIHLRKSLSDNTTLLNKQKEKNSNLSILLEKYNAIAGNISYVTNALPQTPSSPLLLAQIQSIILENNLTVISLESSEVELTKKDEGKNLYSSYVFSLSAEGTYNNVLNFINQIVDFQRIITINSISMTKNARGISQITLIGTGYFKK